MSAPHFTVLPTIALQLAVLVERYRRALRQMARDRRDHEAKEDVVESIRLAGPLAFALPMLWASWGEMVVRHGTFMKQWLRGTSDTDMQQAWRLLEIRAEIVAQRCVEWALRDRPEGAIAAAVAEPFAAWDQTRREAFEVARHVAALREDNPTDPTLAALRERHAVYLQLADRLYDAARAALEHPAAEARVQHAEALPPEVLQYRALHERWRVAEEAAAAAELAIVEMDLKGLDVSSAQRNVATMLRAVAVELRTAAFGAGRI